MSNFTKLMKQAASGAAGESVYVEDVFSTVVYSGGSAQNFEVGVDMTEGGLLWFKQRSNVQHHALFDSESDSDFNKYLKSNSTEALNNLNDTSHITVDSEGFNLTNFGFGITNQSGRDYVTWAFRKQAGFFDVVTYTGDGSSTRTLSHNLDANIGAVLIKGLNESEGWVVAHRSTSAGNKVLQLNTTSAETTVNHTYISGSTLTVGTAGNPSFSSNDSGINYVAYLFAHDDQSFGDGSDESIIKCGSFSAPTQTIFDINLGWEPQFFFVKKTSGSGDWYLIDVMRGFNSDANSGPQNAVLRANTSGAEGAEEYYRPTATGIQGWHLGSGDYIYIAIRRPMKTPESGTDVFKTNDVDNGASKPDSLSNFPVDMYFRRYVNTTNDTYLLTRLTSPNALKTNGSDAESAFSTDSAGFDYNDGVMNIFSSDNSDFHTWMFKRATGFFDVVAYNGNEVAGTSHNHNLGVTPEMMIVKSRSDGYDWVVWVNGFAITDVMQLNSSSAKFTNDMFDTLPTSSVFYVANNPVTNRSGSTYIAYLFATVDGVSKVGSYTGDGTSDSSHVIDCGFSAGARFVMIKRTDSTGDWWVFDTTRGLVAGADTRIALNSTSAEYTGIDDIDPHSSGFIVTNPGGSDLNVNNATYIFLAIA